MDDGWKLEPCFDVFVFQPNLVNPIILSQCDWDLLHPMVPFLGSSEVSESLSPGLFNDHPEF